MTPATVRAIHLYGTRYRCRLRYVHIESPDGLSNFVLDVARSQQYQRLEVLLQSFGLPPRVMEGVLADLVRTRRARLDIARGRIIPLEGEVLAMEYQDRRVLDVWQDHVTGAILPASVIAPYTVKAEGAKTLSRRSTDEKEFIGFLDASDASLLSALIRIDPTLEFSLDGGWQLDRFVNRVHLRSQPLWIPLAWATVGDNASPFVDAPEIPWWLGRAWTGQLVRTGPSSLAATVSEGKVTVEADGSIFSAFQYARIGFHARRWLESAQEHLDLSPAPESLQEMRTLDRRFGALQARLLSMVSVTVRREARLREELTRAEDSIALAVPEMERAAAWGLSGGVRQGVEAVLIHGAGTAREDHAFRRAHITGWCDEYALLDGKSLVLPLAGAAETARVVEFSSLDVGRAVEGLLGRLIGFENAGSLSVLRRSANAREVLKEARFGDNGLSVSEVLGGLAEFRRALALSMQDQRLRKATQGAEEPGGTVDGLVRSVAEGPSTSLGGSHPDLLVRLDALRRPLSHRLASNYSAFTFVEQGELPELLKLIAAEIPGASNLCRIVSRLPPTLGEEAFAALERGVAAGWRFHLCQPATAEQAEHARSLRSRLPSVHIRFFSAPADWKAGVVTLNDVVIAGTFHILAEESPDRLSQVWAIVLGDVAVGDELLHGSDAWPEIARA